MDPQERKEQRILWSATSRVCVLALVSCFAPVPLSAVPPMLCLPLFAASIDRRTGERGAVQHRSVAGQVRFAGHAYSSWRLLVLHRPVPRTLEQSAQNVDPLTDPRRTRPTTAQRSERFCTNVTRLDIPSRAAQSTLHSFPSSPSRSIDSHERIQPQQRQQRRSALCICPFPCARHHGLA